MKRRDFIKNSAQLSMMSLIPVEKFYATIVSQAIREAEAAEAVAETRNYVSIHMIGAPPRFSFDQWLKTSPGESFQSNPMVANRFLSSGGSVFGTEYATFNHNGLLVPSFFQQSVMNASGAQRPLMDLLKNMMVIRGYGTGFDGHAFNAVSQQAPVGGIASIAGVSADGSRKTFEAVQLPDRGGFGSFVSSQSKAISKLGTDGNPIQRLLQGYSAPTYKKASDLKQRNQESYEKAQAILKARYRNGSKGSDALAKNFTNTLETLKRGFNNLESYWNEAYQRYTNIINSSMRMSNIPGINDISLISDESNKWNLFTSDAVAQTLSKDFDARIMVAKVSNQEIAAGLAFAEYVLKESLATSIELTSVDIRNVQFASTTSGGLVTRTATCDMHETGAFPALLLTNSYFRGITSGILELSSQLSNTQVEGKNLWNETVVQLTSDFGRSARAAGNGQDHGFNSMVTSVYSGIIKNPLVVGNIQSGGYNNGSYAGTQGIGTEISGYNQKGRPTPSMMASTVAELLRPKHNPYVNIAAPLVKVENDEVKYSSFGVGKITG